MTIFFSETTRTKCYEELYIIPTIHVPGVKRVPSRGPLVPIDLQSEKKNKNLSETTSPRAFIFCVRQNNHSYYAANCAPGDHSGPAPEVSLSVI